MLVTCPECGKAISEDAAPCPYCGKYDAGHKSKEYLKKAEKEHQEWIEREEKKKEEEERRKKEEEQKERWEREKNLEPETIGDALRRGRREKRK